MIKLCIILMCLFCAGCDVGSTCINKISGHEEGSAAYHEETSPLNEETGA